MFPGFPNGSDFFIHQHASTPGAPAAVGAAPVASSTPPTVAKAELPSVKKRPKRSKGGAKGDGGPDGGMKNSELYIIFSTVDCCLKSFYPNQSMFVK